MAASSSAPNVTTGAMMFVRTENMVILEELRRRLSAEARAVEAQPADLRLSDFDDVHYRLEVPADKLSIIRLSMCAPFFKDIAPTANEHLKSVYGALVMAPLDGADVTLEIDAAALADEAVPELIQRVALLRRHAMAAPFLKALAAISSGAGASAASVAVTFRPHETTHILPRGDRLSVVYTLEFADDTDRAMARVIAQEFVEAQRQMTSAPPVNFNDLAPPLELRGREAHQTSALVGYLTFSIFPRHFDTPARRDATVNNLIMFRTYLDYHIKAAKSYIHSRMRARVDGWMQVLNRAQPEDPSAVKDKKVASGKTFVRKV